MTRLAVSAHEAAKLFCLKTDEFRRLVAAGSMPGPRRIGEHERWAVSDLEAILSGEAAWKDDEEFEV